MTAPVHVGDELTDVMGRASGCPNGKCHNTTPPRAAVPTREGWMTSYLCEDCGTAWTVEWSD